jgi:hypothetical protein
MGMLYIGSAVTEKGVHPQIQTAEAVSTEAIDVRDVTAASAFPVGEP